MPIIIETDKTIQPLQKYVPNRRKSFVITNPSSSGSSAGHDSTSPNLQAGGSTDAGSMIVELDT